MRKSIALAYLEDDQNQSDAVVKWLAKQCIHCHVFDNTKSMLAALDTNNFDAIMLDVELDGEPAGLEVLRYLRESDETHTPTMMVSAKAHWHDALENGANDFLEKPLNENKLLVHLHRLLRPVAKEAAIENYPPFQLNTTRRKIMFKGDCVDLSEDEYELALTLFRHFGKVLSYKQLIGNLPTDQLTPVRKVQSDLLKLKRKMNLRDIDGWRLESVYHHGYRLVNAQYDPLLTE